MHLNQVSFAWRVFLLFGLTTVFAQHYDIMDKLRGVYIMGAFGDAYGAATEQTALKGIPTNNTCMLTPAGTYYNVNASNIWWIWPPPATVENFPSITDDTSYRAFILENYIIDMLQYKLQFSESGFKAWMQQRSDSLWQRSLEWPQDWLLYSEREMISDWLVMFDLAKVPPLPSTPRQHGTNPFYTPNTPIVFGLYLYLQLAASYAVSPSYSAFDVFTVFSNITALDAQYGHEATGLFAALLFDAVQHDPFSERHSFSDWWIKRAITWSNEWTGQSGTEMETIRTYVNQTYSLGLNMRGRTRSEFLIAYQTLLNDPHISPHHAMKLQDPLTMFGLLTAALAYEPLNDTCQIMSLMRLVTSAPADTDTLASFFGMIVGAYYGEDSIRTSNQCTCDGDSINLGDQLSILSEVLMTIYGIDYRQRAHVLFHFGKVLAN